MSAMICTTNFFIHLHRFIIPENRFFDKPEPPDYVGSRDISDDKLQPEAITLYPQVCCRAIQFYHKRSHNRDDWMCALVI